MAEKSRISNIRSRIIENSKLTKKEALKQILDYLAKNYPKIKISESKPLNSMLPNDIANDVFKTVTGKLNAAADFRERLYLFFGSGAGMHSIPVDLNPLSDKVWVKMFVNEFGILELGIYKKQLDCEKYTLKEYANYLIKYRKAVEITQEEAMSKLKENKMVKREIKAPPGVNLDKTDDHPSYFGLPLGGDTEVK